MIGFSLISFLGAVLLIFALANLVDWIFTGSKWAHTYFFAYPEIWRPTDNAHAGKTGERRVVGAAIGLSILFSFTFVLMFLFLQPGFIFRDDLTRGIVVGVALWLVVALPIIWTQHLFIKMHRGSTVLNALAWLCKLVAASLIMTTFF